MAYCANCGKEINDNAVICPACGVPTNKFKASAQPDNGGFGWGLLGFCLPIVGLILYLVWMNERPLTAKAAGMGALISVLAGVVLYIVYIVIFVAMIGAYGY